MSGIFSSVTNQGSTFGIQTATVRPNPVDGLAYQLYFDAGGEYISVGDGKVWRDVKGASNTYTFGNGLTLAGRNVTNNLTTGKSAGNIIFGFDDDLNGSGLQLWSASELGINSNYILFGSFDDNGTAYFSNTGAWNFGAETDPSLTTPYLYVFQSRGVFNAQWDFNAAIKLLNTTGSHIQSVWQTSAPTGNANQTHLFFDSVGSPSFRIGTNNWFKFTPNTLTAPRNYALQDSNYTLAGIDIAQTFTALQTFSAGATFGSNLTVTANAFVGTRTRLGSISLISLASILELAAVTNVSAANYSTSGLGINQVACTYTSTTSSGTIPTTGVNTFAIPTLAASNATTLNNASTFYIAGPPTAGTNISILNNYALLVNSGNSYFGGKITSTANSLNFATQTPASATAIGTTGDIAWDTNYIYVCVNTNTWKRSSITTW